MRWLTDAKFANARNKELPWIEVAAIFAEGLDEAAKGGEAARTRYQKDAARHTGYSIGMLRNLAATHKWLRTNGSRIHLPESVVLKSFTALDLIRRLDVYTGTADIFLARLGTETGVRVSALRAELKAIARQREAARRLPNDGGKPVVAEETVLVEAEPKQVLFAAHQMRPSLAQMRSWRSMGAMEDIAKLLPKLSGEEVHHFGRPEGVSPLGIRATAIAWLDADMTQADAFEIVNAGHGLGRSTLSDHVSRAIASSRFFRRHFLVFTYESEPDMVYKAKESIERLKVPGVGIVWFGHTGEDAILLMPKDSPTPDCRERLKDICKLGHWQ